MEIDFLPRVYMKYILPVLLLSLATFAQNTKYKDGSDCKCDSISITLYESGIIKNESPYLNNQINGNAITYNIIGGIYSVTPYINGKKEGVEKSTGYLTTTETPYKNDKINGITRTYFDSGSLLSENLYSNDLLNGTSKSFYESGKINSTTPFVNDKINGIEKYYYESGALKTELPYVNGVLHGNLKVYFESGKLAGTKKYVNDKFVGLTKCTDGRQGNDFLNCLN